MVEVVTTMKESIEATSKTNQQATALTMGTIQQQMANQSAEYKQQMAIQNERDNMQTQMMKQMMDQMRMISGRPPDPAHVGTADTHMDMENVHNDLHWQATAPSPGGSESN